MQKKILGARVKSAKDNTIIGIASTPTPDRDGDVVDPMGVDTENFQKNPVLLWGHDAHSLPIGKVTNITKSLQGIEFEAEFAVKQNPLAKQVWELMRDGFLNSFSIGFMPKERENEVIKQSELFEISVVNIPANPEALMSRAYKSFEKSLNKLEVDYKNMYVLSDLRSKLPEELSAEELEFLKANEAELTDEEKVALGFVAAEDEHEEAESEELEDSEEAVEESKEEESQEEATESEEVAEEPVAEQAVEEAAEKAVQAQIAKLKAEAMKTVKSEVAKAMKEKKLSKKSKSITDSMKSDAKVTQPLVKFYKTKSGEELGMEKDQALAIAKWYRAVAQGRPDLADKHYMEYAQKFEPLNTLTPGEGGYLVPSVWLNILIRIMNDAAVIRPRATVLDLSGAGDTFYFNSIASRPKTYWGQELQAKATSSITFNQGSLTPYRLAAIVSSSMELEDDALVNVMGLITQELADAMVREEEKAFATGDGSGKPTGLTQYNLPSIDAGGTLDYKDFVRAYYRMPQAYRERAVWIGKSSTIAGIVGMTDDNNRPLLDANGAIDPITNRPAQRILGSVVLEQNDLPSNTIIFADLSKYYIGDKMRMRIDTSREATVAGKSAFEHNLTHVRIEERIDGELLDTRAGVKITNTGTN